MDRSIGDETTVGTDSSRTVDSRRAGEADDAAGSTVGASSGSDTDDSSGSDAGDGADDEDGVLPPGGRLVWVPPDGDPREVPPGAVRLATDQGPSTASRADASAGSDRPPSRADGGAVSLRTRESSSRVEAVARRRACSDCGATRSVPTIVREHAACGHVGLDGFVGHDGDAALSCPKCGAVEEARPSGMNGGGRTGDAEVDEPGTGDSSAFAAVGRVHSCVECGRVLDRPLGAVPGYDGSGSDDDRSNGNRTDAPRPPGGHGADGS